MQICIYIIGLTVLYPEPTEKKKNEPLKTLRNALFATKNAEIRHKIAVTKRKEKQLKYFGFLKKKRREKFVISNTLKII